MKPIEKPSAEVGTVTKPIQDEKAAGAAPLVSEEGRKPAVDFDAIEESPLFRELVREKKRFLIPSIVLFFVLYLLFPLLISYTDWLHQPAVGDISWSWVYALGLFIMTWVLVMVYMKRAAAFDEKAAAVLDESGYGEGDGVR